MRIHLFLLGLLATSGALAEPDSFGLGTGRDGLLRVELPDTTINRFGQLTANAAAGTKELTISNAAAFTAGELVLVHQSTGLLPAPASGDQRTLNLFPDTSAVGRFEYARVEGVAAGALKLTAPLKYAYAANVSQVVNVPEYTDVQVLSGASLKAVPWDGSVGGILALLATGTLTNSGIISADGAGFRGGTFINHLGGFACSSLDEAAGSGASYKGEGLVAGRFGTASGRGNLTHGGGSGNCHNAGGAGGGHGGVGGKGGFSDGDTVPSDDVGGLGGAPVRYFAYEHLVFGGGGGGGGGHVDVGTAGGAGGGVVLIRARDVAGTGRFSATGASADFVTPAADDGAGGGGAGGVVSIRVERTLVCGQAQAAGGAGGDTRHPSTAGGPGGGGGGGLVFLQGDSTTCPMSVVAGNPGQSTAAGGTFGAGPSVTDSGASYGSAVEFQVPFLVPAVPVLTLPANGSTGVARRPRIEGTAEQGVIVHLFLDGAPYILVTPDNTGVFFFNVTRDLASGPHELQASAAVFGSFSALSAPSRFDVAMPAGDGGTPDGGPIGDGGVTEDGGVTKDGGVTEDGGVTKDGGVTGDGGLSGDAPVLVAPAEGEAVDPLPMFAGTSRTGSSVGIEVDGTEVARVSLDEQRRFRYVLSAEKKLAPGAHKAVARAWDEAGKEGLASPATHFEVKSPAEMEVGCGCGASPGVGLGAVALLLSLGAARLRRRR